MALEASDVAALPGENLLTLLQEYPPITMQVMSRLVQMVRQSTGRIMDLPTLTANNRVQAELLGSAREGENEDWMGRGSCRTRSTRASPEASRPRARA